MQAQEHMSQKVAAAVAGKLEAASKFTGGPRVSREKDQVHLDISTSPSSPEPSQGPRQLVF